MITKMHTNMHYNLVNVTVVDGFLLDYWHVYIWFKGKYKKLLLLLIN